MATIGIHGLTKRYAARTDEEVLPALNALQLEVAAGELLVLVGPSGCGKSTALRLIAGLEEPTAGRIEVDGVDLVPIAPQDRDVAMVFQGYALYPHMTVRRNMAFPLKMRGVSSRERARKVTEIAEMLGLGDKLERLPGQLSGGERQRVAMARAIVRSPKVFLFDEPLSNLDAKLRAALRVELASLVRRLGTTSVYVTHDQAEAMTMGDRVAVLRGGLLQQVDTPRRIYEEPANAFVASFVGTPEMNLVALRGVGPRARNDDVEVALPEAIRGQEQLTLGFRPEHLRIGDAPAGAAQLEAVVRAVEPLGPETLVYLRATGGELRARLPGFGGPAVDERVALFVEPAHLHFFDADSGARLS